MLSVLGGIILLVTGAELLVRGASRLARASGVSPLIIGLTVVAYGTSAPELSVSLIASLRGEPDIAIGNVVGSNIFNVLMVLGASALIVPLTVSAKLVRIDVPVMIAASGALFLASLDGRIGRIDGLVFSVAVIIYTIMIARSGTAETAAGAETDTRRDRSHLALHLLLAAGGFVLLVAGSRFLVNGATGIARTLGISEMVIGLTIVAAGTSLPELATSIVAAARGERDIAVGNVVGSNIFNILAILGLCGLVSGGVPVTPSALRFDIPVMFAVAVACLPIFLSGNRITRGEGAMFVVYYGAYLAYLVMTASRHAALPAFSTAMAMFVIPLTLVGLIVSAVRSRR